MKTGWKVQTLNQLCNVFTDGDWIESKDQSSDGIRLIQTGNVGNGVFKNRAEKARYISEATFQRLRCTEIFEGDCLVSRLPDPVGRSCLIPSLSDKCITAVDCTILRFDRSKILPELFTYYSQSREYAGAVSSSVGGATRQRISRKNLGLLPIPHPALDEQRRIVELLDEAFAGIATATANALKNLTNARALFESELERAFGNSETTSAKTTIGAEVDFCFGFAFKSNRYTSDLSGIRLLRGDNIINGSFRWDGVMRWPAAERDEYRTFELQSGDVVLAMDRTWVKSGLKFAVIEDRDLPLLQVQRVARMRCRASLLNKFLAYQIQSPAFTKYIVGIQTGLGVPHISGKQIAAFNFIMPSLNKQKQIVTRLDAIQALLHRLEATYEKELSALAELKQSLLQKAFAGELT